MYSSRRFWIPVASGTMFTVLGLLWLIMMMFAGGAHNSPDPNSAGIGTLLFPFAVLFEKFIPESLVLPAIAFLVQFPIYGAVAGYGNSNDKLKPYLLMVAAVHILGLLAATFIARG